jgi:hypothetical protein
LKETELKEVPMGDGDIGVLGPQWLHAYMRIEFPAPVNGDYIYTGVSFAGSGRFIKLNVLYNTDLLTTVKDLVDRINNPINPQKWVEGSSYSVYEIVTDDLGFYWESQINGNALPLIDDEDTWIKIGTLANWKYYYVNFFPILPNPPIFYTDPDISILTAIQTTGELPSYEGSFKIYDNRLNSTDAFSSGFGNIGPNWDFTLYDFDNDLNAFYANYGNIIKIYLAGLAGADATTTDVSHVFPSIRNNVFSNHPDFIGVVNFYENDEYPQNVNTTNNRYKYAFSPQFYVKFLIKKICLFIGYQYNEEFFSEIDTACKLLYTNTNITQKLNLGIGVFPNNYKLQSCLPESTLSEFFNGFRSIFFWGVFFDVSKNKIKFKKLDDVLTDTPIDWTSIATPMNQIYFDFNDGVYAFYTYDDNDIYASQIIVPDFLGSGKYPIKQIATSVSNALVNPTVGDVVYISSLNAYYQFRSDDGVTFDWKFLSNGQIGYIDGKGEYHYQCLSDTPLMSVEAKPTTGSWKIPKVQQYAFDFYDVNSVRSKLRFMNYYGFELDSLGNAYPYAGGENTKYNGDLLPNEPIVLEGVNGSARNNGKKWFKFLNNTQDVKFQIKIDPIVFQQLDFSTPVKIGSDTFLIKSINVKMPLESGLAVATLCPIRI